MKTINHEQLGKRIVFSTIGVITLIGLLSIWFTEASRKDERRFRQVSKVVHKEACNIAAKDSDWTVAALDTVFSSPGSDHYVVKLRITDGKTMIRLNRYPQQTYLGWGNLTIGSRVQLTCSDRIRSAKLSDHLFVSLDEHQTL